MRERCFPASLESLCGYLPVGGKGEVHDALVNDQGAARETFTPQTQIISLPYGGKLFYSGVERILDQFFGALLLHL